MMGGKKKRAMATLWFHDIVDNEDTTIEVALWKAEEGDFSRLKQNYVPPSGSLEDWQDSDRRERMSRIGSVLLEMKFLPGISGAHKAMLQDSSGTDRGVWDGFDREKAGGLREGLGEFEGNLSQSQDDGQADGDVSRTKGHMSMENGSKPSMRRSSSGGAVEDNSKPSMNTFASNGAVENESFGGQETERERGGSDTDDEERSDCGGKGLVSKVKDWRQHERELHRDHRGIMQTKPARTAEWIKDNVQEGVHGVKSRFAMKARQPDVETEV